MTGSTTGAKARHTNSKKGFWVYTKRKEQFWTIKRRMGFLETE